jgi:hypothetical protein
MSETVGTVAHVPLTIGQKARLIGECLPAGFFLAAGAVYLLVVNRFGGPRPGILLAFAVIVAIVGVRALARLRDLRSGVALVADDQLRGVLGRGASSGRPGHFGEFSSLGTLRLTMKAFHRAQRGRRHRIVYSPASRIVWSLDVIA